MKKIKVGIIGVGNMGSSHAVNLRQVPAVQLTALCDINPAAFERVPETLRETVQCFSAPEEFFAKADVDLVMIAVPHYAHPDLAIAAMNAGKHFILEKPICVHKAEAQRLIAECAKHPELVKSAMFNQRTRTLHQRLKGLIESGELGRINRVNWIITDWFRTQAYYDSGDWRASWRGEGGGVLLNQCPHNLDLMQWFFGMPAKVTAQVRFGKFHDIEVEDEVNAYLEYGNGAVGNFITTTGEFPGTNRLEIAAEMGRLVMEKNKLLFKRNVKPCGEFCRTTPKAWDSLDCWDCEIPYGAEPADRTEHMRIVANVADAINSGAKLIAPVEEGIRGLELGNAMLLSGWMNGATVELPIDAADYAERLQKLIATSRYTKKPVSVSGDNSGFANSFGN